MSSPRKSAAEEFKELQKVYETYKPEDHLYQFKNINSNLLTNAHLFKKIQSGIHDILNNLDPEVTEEGRIGEFIREFDAIQKILTAIESSLNYTNKAKGIFSAPDTELHKKIIDAFESLDTLAKDMRQLLKKHQEKIGSTSKQDNALPNQQTLVVYKLYKALFDIVTQFVKLPPTLTKEEELDDSLDDDNYDADYFDDDYQNIADKKMSSTNKPSDISTSTSNTTILPSSSSSRNSPGFSKPTVAMTSSTSSQQTTPFMSTQDTKKLLENMRDAHSSFITKMQAFSERDENDFSETKAFRFSDAKQ